MFLRMAYREMWIGFLTFDNNFLGLVLKHKVCQTLLFVQVNVILSCISVLTKIACKKTYARSVFGK